MSFKVSVPQIGPYFCAINERKYRFWCRSKIEGVGVIRYKLADSSRIQVHAFEFLPRFDYTGLIDLELEPGHSYMVQVGVVKKATLEQLSVPDLDLKWPKDSEIYLNTFPSVENDPQCQTSFILGSGRHTDGWFSVKGDEAFACINDMMHCNAIDPQFLLMAGDQVYLDANGKRIGSPPTNQEACFKKYRDAYRSKEFSRLLKRIPVYSIYNEHEIQRQWSIGKFETREKGFDFKTFTKAIVGYQSYQANMSPVIQDISKVSQAPDYGLNIYGEKGYGEIPFWYQFSHGTCDFFVMDARGERREPYCMVSKEQLEEVQTFLIKNPDRKKFIVSAVPVFPDTKPPFGYPADKWTSFPNQRKQLLKFIREKQKTGEIKDVVFLSGGLGCSFVAQAAFPDVQYSMYSVVSSSFNRLNRGLQDSDFVWDELRGFPKNELSVERKTYGGGCMKVQTDSNFACMAIKDDELTINFFSNNGEKLEDHCIHYNMSPVRQPEAVAVVGQFDGFGGKEGTVDKKIVAFEKTPDPGRKFY